MYSLELFVIAIYCLIKDALYPHFCHQHGQPRRTGFPPALSDSEWLALEVVGHYLGYGTQKPLYEQLPDRFGTWFPGLKDRVAFTRQSANLWQVKAGLHQHIVTPLAGDRAPLQIIDTLPVPICKVARRFQRRIFRTQDVLEGPPPTKGSCAAKDEAYFGFKGGVRITDYGLIVPCPAGTSLWPRQHLSRRPISRHTPRHKGGRRQGFYRPRKATEAQNHLSTTPADTTQNQHAPYAST